MIESRLILLGRQDVPFLMEKYSVSDCKKYVKKFTVAVQVPKSITGHDSLEVLGALH